jgi:zinc transport system permease protein
MGLLVVNSLLIAPAAAARNLARSTRQYHVWAVALALFSGTAGLITAYYLNAAAGATIALYARGFYVLSLLFRAD